MTFCNKVTIPMNVEDMTYILNTIRNKVDLRIPKIYDFNGSGNLRDLENNHYLLTFKTHGIRTLLFLTTIKGKKYSIFIVCNKKLELYNVKLRFNRELYNDTILDGEILMNTKQNWIFMINDIIYNKNNFVGNILLGERIGLISDILRKQYKFDDYLNCCHLQMRSYFLFNHLEMMSDTHNNQLLIIPERSNKSTLSLTIRNLSDNEKIITNLSTNDGESENDKFFVKGTDMPDVFELYMNEVLDKNNFRGILCIATKQQSYYMKKLFDELKENQKGIYVNCLYNSYLKAWEPILI